MRRVLLCECGEFVEDFFRDYIETKVNPSTPTIGHNECGLLFNFIDGNLPKLYSSKKQLKSLALKFAEINKFEYKITEVFLVEVDRLKSKGTMSDAEILIRSFENIVEEGSRGFGRKIFRGK